MIEQYNQLPPGKKRRMREDYMDVFSRCKKTFFNKLNGVTEACKQEKLFFDIYLNPQTQCQATK